ncbi:EamA/RhaT family transporter, partial [Bacteroides sp. AM22-3LB]
MRWHKPTRTYASAYTYVRIGLHVRTHEPARIYVIVSGSVIFCAGIGLVCLL